MHFFRQAVRFDRYVLILLFATLVWGATFPVLKIATESLSGVEVTALRFLIAAVCMAPFAWRLPAITWRSGFFLGALALLPSVAQAFGLEFISSNRSAFLTSLNVLMVPLLGAAFGTRPSWSVAIASVLACAGIGLMSYDGGSHLIADVVTVFGALGYAIYVIALSASAKNHVPSQLATAQIFWMALLGCIWMGLSSGIDGIFTLATRIDGDIFLGLLFLGVVASAGMFFLQVLAQSHVPANKAAVIYAMEPVFAALFAWLLLSEILTLRAALGAAIVVFAVLLSEFKPTSYQLPT